MNTVELLNIIENICGFSNLDTTTLLAEIEGILNIKKVKSPLPIMKDKTKAESNPFAIEDKNISLNLLTEEDFKQYKNKITDLKQLKVFLGKNEQKGIFKLVDKMIKYIEDKLVPKLQFDEKDNLSEEVADKVYKDILEKHIKNIIVSLHREVFHKEISINENSLELLKCLNQYLSNLGVYSIIAKKGDLYEGKIMEHYDGHINNEDRNKEEVKISYIDNPAYCIRYKDESGDECNFGIQGRCFLE